MKRLFDRRKIAALLYYTGILSLYGRVQSWLGLGGPLFLMGHRVLPQHARADGDAIDRMALICGHAISDQELERRLRFVLRVRPAGDPAELVAGMPSGRSFYLTFDDGYADNVNVAGPVLQRLGVKAVIFTVSEVLENPHLSPWWDFWGAEALAANSDEAAASASYAQRCMARKNASRGLRRDAADGIATGPGKPRYLSTADVHKPSPVFYFAIHTASHANLSLLNDAELHQEIEDGRAAIADAPAYLPLLAFPFGYYNDRVLAYLKAQQKIVLAFATGNGDPRQRFCLKRVNLNTSPYYLFVANCLGIFDLFGRR